MTLDLGVGLKLLSTKGRCGMSAGGRKEGAVTGGGRGERGIHRSVPDLELVALLHMCG